jgi:molecular chaperone GrpE
MTQDRKGPVTQLREQLAEKSDSCKKLQEDYLRALADFDNLRKRFERDAEVSRRFTLEALMMDLLPVLDNFERALKVTGPSATVDGLQKGMDLIQRQLREALRKHGLEEYSCIGAQFDPRRAEAISFVHTDEYAPGTVVSETSKGYACGDRVLRPARVVVAKETGRSEKSEARGQSAEAAEAEAKCRKAEAEGQNPEAEPGEIAESGSESKD